MLSRIFYWKQTDHKYSKNSDMYFPMLIITTTSVWENKNQIKNKKEYMPKMNNLFVSDTLEKLFME